MKTDISVSVNDKPTDKKAQVAKNLAKTKKKDKNHPMEVLLSQSLAKPIPKIGELVEGIVLSVSKNEVHLDIEGLTSGVVRGKEIWDESGEYSKIKVGDKVFATVLELENEEGKMELSFRYAGHQKAWDQLQNLLKNQELCKASIIDANKGGLMIKVGNVMGFLPVSQLTTEHYPRVEGGDKNKILVALKKFIDQKFKVKIIDVNENEEKLIVSEKAAVEEKQIHILQKYKVGDVIEGKITGVVDFGAFVEFGDKLEGLIHISELAWQRIDNPKQIVKVGDKIKAEIIAIEDSKISLSMRKLIKDPWRDVSKKYKIGQKVKGKVLKFNPFGAFIELDKDIHGLVHISEISDKNLNHPEDVLIEEKTYDFKIISLEPENHRLGLSLKTSEKTKSSEKEGEKNKVKEEKKDKVEDKTKK
ncbi:S1 RNA-binding domain-containing protein [Patescibacteria group bacterium]|nr:S1 RNA-binding domain-containing protein [Patescibacteria group bacterium]